MEKTDTSIDCLLRRIFNLNKFGIKLGLQHMKKAVSLLRLNLEQIRFVHIAGTNGKGSVAAMLKSLLKTNTELKIGLYTSPHLFRYNERIKVDNKEITDERLACYAKTIFNTCSEIRLTFFEFTTLLAFMHFLDSNVDIAIMETGMLKVTIIELLTFLKNRSNYSATSQ